MSRREQIRLDDDEVRAFLEKSQTVILVSNGVGGHPHPMPMWFALDDEGAVRMTTYRVSQKVKNLRRDPRVALLVESGTEYSALKGAVLYGRAEVLDDFDLVVDTLLRVGGQGGLPADDARADAVREGMRGNASKRVVIRVAPERVVSWDHAKLGGVY